MLCSKLRLVDPLITELVNGAIGAEEHEVRESYAVALGKAILSGGKNISPAVKPSIVNFLEDNFAVPSQKGAPFPLDCEQAD